MRVLILIAFGCWTGLAFLIYDIKHEARALEAHVAALQKDIAAERENLAVMRAEWSLASRPDHVERQAKAILKFEPVKPAQATAAAKPKTPQGPRKPAPDMAESDAIAALIGRSARPSRERSDAPR